jgi:ABC-2 type transport system ATP-binding protein
MMQWAIEADNLVKQYGNIKALNQVSLRVQQGEIYGFLGPNGAGKTTFIKILLNLSFADKGSAKLLGIDSKKVAARKNVGFLPETPYFYESLTVEEFLIFQAQLICIQDGNIRAEVDDSLKRLDIVHERKKKLGTLSKGIKQRVGIAQALLNAPALLLLDEPTSGLDPIGIKEVRDILLEMKHSGTTIFINSHFLSEIERTCDRVAIINKGKMIASGTKDDLSAQENYLEIVGEGFDDTMIAQINAISKKTLKTAGNRMRIFLEHEDDVLAVHQMIVSNGGKIQSFTRVSESLEDIFYRLIKNEEG